MYLSVHKDIVIEDNSFKVNEENIWDLAKYVSLGCIRTVSTALTEAIRDEFPSMHTVKS